MFDFGWREWIGIIYLPYILTPFGTMTWSYPGRCCFKEIFIFGIRIARVVIVKQ